MTQLSDSDKTFFVPKMTEFIRSKDSNAAKMVRYGDEG
jgi:hypothetical protein